MNTPLPRLDVTIAQATPTPVVAGFPFPPGMVHDAGALGLRDASGQSIPLAARALRHWPDQSIQWALLAFSTQTTGLHEVRLGESVPQAATRVQLKQDDEGLTLDNGALRCRLARRGPGPIASLHHEGRTVLAEAGDLQFVVGDASSLHDGGAAREVTVLEQSPLRARVRVSGGHYDTVARRCLHYRLDVEAWAGSPTLRLDYQFMHLEPGRPTLRVPSITMRCRPRVGESPRRHLVQSSHGPLGRPRVVLREGPVEILGDAWSVRPHVRALAALDDPGDAPAYMLVRAHSTSDWMGLTGESGSTYLSMRDFTALYPKRLASAGDELQLDLWPAEAGALELPQGRSRRATLLLACFAAAPELPGSSAVQAALDLPCHEGRACVEPGWARHCGVFGVEQTPAPGDTVRFEKYLRRLVEGLKLERGMFDLGDGIESGYSEGYAAAALVPARASAQPQAGPANLQLRPTPLADMEPVWANNEYDILHTLAIELLRTGQRALWPTLTQAVRHNIEVDFVHYSDNPWQHHGSPAHSALHNQASSYPSHIWTQGLLEYHVLTGDADALEAAVKLGDTILRNLNDAERGKHLWGFNREVGWPVLALACLCEATREERFARELGRIVDFLMAFNRHDRSKVINLSGVDSRDDFHRQMVGSFFGYASMIEGIDLYVKLSGRQDVRAWLLTLLHDLRQAAQATHRAGRPMTIRRMFPVAMAVGYELSGDVEFLRWGMVSIHEMLDEDLWHQPPREVKAIAMVHRGLVRFLGHAHRAGLLRNVDYALPGPSGT
jgi:hypothetical protein